MLPEEDKASWLLDKYFRIIGVRLNHPAPLKDVYLPLGTGVHAVYGPTGVGKTKVLEGVRVAVHGHTQATSGPFMRLLPTNSLFLQLGHDREASEALTGGDWGYTSPFVDALRDQVRLGSVGDPEELLRILGELESSNHGNLEMVVDPRELMQLRLRIDGDVIEPVGMRQESAKEVAQAGFLAVETSRASEPPKTVLCIDEQSASSELRNLVAGTFSALEAFNSGDADYPDVCHDPTATCLPWLGETKAGNDSFLRGLRSLHPLLPEEFIRQSMRPGWAPLLYLDMPSMHLVAPLIGVIWVGTEVEYVRTPAVETATPDSEFVTDVHVLVRELAEIWGQFPHPGAESWGDKVPTLFETANRFYGMLRGYPIGIGLQIGDFSDHISGTHPRIVAIDAASSVAVTLDRLSATEARWVKVALYLAWHSVCESEYGHGKSGQLLLLIDEPELGLPLSLQRQLSRGLVSIAEELKIPVVVATHSASLLDDLSVATYRCGRDEDGYARLSEVQRTDREGLGKLGVPISEELQLVRAVLVVEGQHEAVLLEEAFGEELAMNRIKVLPIRGTRQLRLLAAEGELLFRYLDAPFVLLTDRTRSDQVDLALQAARGAGEPGEVRKAIEAALDPRTDEEQVLRSLLIIAAESGLVHRIRAIRGLEKDDVLHYLPCDYLVPGSTWDDLVELHKQRGAKEPSNFKRWLEVSKQADITDENLRSAVQQMDEIPEEWIGVLRTCIDVARVTR